MPTAAKWIVAPEPDAELVRKFADELSLSTVVVRLAVQRGFTELDALVRYLYPRLQDLGDPFSLPGVVAAVERIFEAVDRGELIVLFGDYDVDGVSSIALLDSVLRHYGARTSRFVPTRLEEGYGLSRKGIENATRLEQPGLLIAADCGTNSYEESLVLRERGIDLIVLDHHEPSSEATAECVALVNPKLGDSFHYLCTAGVVFKVAHALLKARPKSGFDLKDYLDLVALGTIADIVPLEGENRIFARRGLAQLDRTIHPGVVALKQVAGVRTPARSNDVGFKLGPRINAAGRLDSAVTSLDLLLCQSPAEAAGLAAELDQHNRERQDLEKRTREEAEAVLEAQGPEARDFGVVVGSRGWHPGVVGIVASRLSKRLHRPVFVVGIDEDGLGKGSGRSVDGISLVKALDDARHLIEAGGGHEMAAGVSVREENLDAFREAFVRSVREQATGDALVPKLRIDARVTLAELTLDLLDSYELLRPFGAGNPQPVLLAEGVHLADEPRRIKDRHLKFRFFQEGQEREGILFNASGELPRLPWDIAFTIDRNEWRGRVKLNLIVNAIRASQ